MSFPVMEGGPDRSIPWALVEPLRDRALQFHGQTLERLAERGGLSKKELWFHFHGFRRMADFPKRSDPKVEQWFSQWKNSLSPSTNADPVATPASEATSTS